MAENLSIGELAADLGVPLRTAERRHLDPVTWAEFYVRLCNARYEIAKKAVTLTGESTISKEDLDQAVAWRQSATPLLTTLTQRRRVRP